MQIDRKRNSRSWSVHPGTLEQVYYIGAEKIGIQSPNFKPTADEILDSLEEEQQQLEVASLREYFNPAPLIQF